MNYYNEHNSFAAEWLRILMAEGHIPEGFVDERDIQEVHPAELIGYTQCHFFAGIGGWPLALKLAGWSEDSPVWTGSPPCQPFSTAGKGLGKSDDRHLAPHFLDLVATLRPPVIFGEQVAAAVKKDEWLDDLLDALEREDYTTGAAVLPACGVGAPHIRQRLFFCATDTDSQRLSRTHEHECHDQAETAPAWSEFERIHATSAWDTWLSESRTGVFANGIPNRVGKLRGYGNAIVPQVAAEVIKGFMSN